MKLLIVEDEKKLRISLANNIPWEKHDIEVVGLAANGREALQWIESRRPELVLLDIHMPKMNGLELAEAARRIDPDIRCIVLSGHDNFGYARQAMELGISRYLLKPAGDTEILNAVLEAADRIRSELARRHNMAELHGRWRQHLPHLQELFMQQWISGTLGEDDLARRGQELQIVWPASEAFAVAVIDIDAAGGTGTASCPGADDYPLLQFSLTDIAKESLGSLAWRVFRDGSGATVAVFAAPEGVHPNQLLLHIHTAAVKLTGTAKECLKLTASAGISGTAYGTGQLALLYRQARKSLEERIVHGNDIVIPYRDTGAAGRGMLPPVSLEKMFESSLETGHAEKAAEVLKKLLACGAAATASAEDVQERLIALGGTVARLIHQQGWTIREVAEDDFDVYAHLSRLKTREQAFDWLLRLVNRYCAYLQKERSGTVHETVRQMLAIVDEQIGKEISLHDVAERLFVNSSYLSRLFKQEVGKPFSNYVIDKKMERAKRLLQEGCKVYDTAERVGYKDVGYFSRLFHKYWGVTPGDVKDSSR
ncbi:response regulator [Paenibacillus mesophilus]|uniref:response regulator transcription factor n=1 Tax=Paenibacillus mesophilus TaxID=2582849 RepID=UPI00110ECAC8|nr:response regulator [Paenibacillus mesophilus]TMV52692.1 response regulator [Paenibacillus mesophilus]